MHKIFSSDQLNGHLDCPHCSWKGKGSDTVQEELFLTDAVEVFCPQCKCYLGMVNTEESS